MRTVEQLLYLEIKKDAFTKACGLCGYFRKVWTAMPRLETPLRNMLIPTTSCSPWALLTRSFWRRLTNMVMYSIASANSWNTSFKKLFSSYYKKTPKTNAHRLMFVALLLRYFSHKCKYQKKVLSTTLLSLLSSLSHTLSHISLSLLHINMHYNKIQRKIT